MTFRTIPSLSDAVSITNRRCRSFVARCSGNNGNGGGIRGNNGNGGGNNGSGGGNGGGNEEFEGENRSGALLALSLAGRSLESVPRDLARGIQEGKIPENIVKRFLEMENSAVFRWLLQFGGFKERLLADDLFLAKLMMECGVGVITKVLCFIAIFFFFNYSSSLLTKVWKSFF